MTRLTAWAGLLFLGVLFAPHPALSQFGTDWTTAGFDAQRSSWVRCDPKISTESVKGPGFKMVWKHKLDNSPRHLNALTPPALFDFYIGYRGFRSLGFVGGGSGRIFVLDTDLARMEWQKSFDSGSAEGTLDCPGGMTANLTRPTPVGLPLILAARGSGRRSPGASAVGKPKEGAVTLKRVRRRPAPPPAARAGAKSARRRPATNVYGGSVQYIFALAADGMLHAYYVSNGEEKKTPLRFLPPNANALGLIVVDETAYVATTGGCGGVEDGVWALDLESKKVNTWMAEGGVAGFNGPAFGPGGMLYVATAGAESSSVVSLDPKTLKQAGRYASNGVKFTSSPVVIDYQESDLLAVASNDGRMRLLRGASLGETQAYRSPVYSADFTPGALTAWRDEAGVTWVLVPSGGTAASSVNFPATNGKVSHGSITAWKVTDKDGEPALEPGWVSRDMVSPLPPIVVNGVVFAVASGEFRGSDSSIGAAERVQRSSPAVLYALDGATGKVLWESGDSIASFAHGMAMSAGGGYVYLVTHDGTLHSFGFAMEH